MKISVLIITINSWDNNNSIGNTLSNIFFNFSNYSFSNIYMKNNNPNNKICNSYFQLTAADSINKLFSSDDAGFSFGNNHSECKAESCKNKNSSFLYRIFIGAFREIIISLCNYNNKKVIEYAKSIQADVIFVPVSNSIAQQILANYISKHINAKLIMYHMDDTYTLKQLYINPFTWMYKLVLRHYTKKNILKADINYVISDKQKEEYSKYFDRNFKILYKYRDFTQSPDCKKINTPIKIVYTGNIIPGRWKTLKKIGKALDKINKNGIKIQLYLYTRNTLSEKIKKALNFKDSIILMGAVEAKDVPVIQENADILLHIESFHLKERLDCRLSFSTKIVDYLNQSKCIFAVGPSEIASIDYLLKNDAAVVATSENEIEEKLKMLIEKPKIIEEFGKKAWECGKRNHQADKIKKMLKEDFENCIKNCNGEK